MAGCQRGNGPVSNTEDSLSCEGSIPSPAARKSDGMANVPALNTGVHESGGGSSPSSSASYVTLELYVCYQCGDPHMMIYSEGRKMLVGLSLDDIISWYNEVRREGI